MIKLVFMGSAAGSQCKFGNIELFLGVEASERKLEIRDNLNIRTCLMGKFVFVQH